MNKKIYLIRHTTPRVDLSCCYGQTDLELASSFSEEVKRIKKHFSTVLHEAQFISSPLKRCYQLAKELTKEKIKLDNGLKELNFGFWEMQKWSEIDKPKLDYWVEDFVNRKTPNGESFLDLSNRAMQSFHNALKLESDVVAIVAHGGVIRVILANILEMPLINIFRMHLDFGAVSAVIYDGEKFKIEFINR